MIMSEGLVSGLLAKISEVEALALSASPGPWRPNTEHDEVLAVDDVTVCDGFALSTNQLRNTVDHVVAHDPQSILGLCRAHRQIIERYQRAVAFEPEPGSLHVTVRLAVLEAFEDVLGSLAEGYSIKEATDA